MLNALFKNTREIMARKRVLRTIEQSILQEPTRSKESIQPTKEVIRTVCNEFNGEETKPTITERVLSLPYGLLRSFQGMLSTSKTKEIQPKPVTGVSILGGNHEEITTVLSSMDKSNPSEKSVEDQLVRKNESETDLDSVSLTIPVMSRKKTVFQSIRSFFTNMFSARTTESSESVRMMYGDTSKYANALASGEYTSFGNINYPPLINYSPLSIQPFQERMLTPPISHEEATLGKGNTSWLYPESWSKNVGTRAERAKQSQDQEQQR